MATKTKTPRRAPARVRQAQMQETRAALIDAAVELFARDGLDAPSLDAICERAGFTRGAFYVHFADRDALLVAVMEKVGADFLGRMFAAAEPAAVVQADVAGAPPEDRGALREAADRFVGAVAAGEYPLMAPPAKKAPLQIRFHQLVDACMRSKPVRERYRSLVEASIEHVAFLVARDRDGGFVREDADAAQMGVALLAMIIGAQTMAELDVPIDPGALSRALLAVLAPARRIEKRRRPRVDL